MQKQAQKKSKEAKKLGKDKLEQIIGMMKGIEDHTVDPFVLNVDEIIRIVQEYYPSWDEPEELNLDAQAIHHLASVIKLQSEWVKQRSTSLYTDPFLLEEKINQKPKEEILGAFLKSWHPVVEMEQLTVRSLADALLYWNALEPIGQRWDQTPAQEAPTGIANRSELVEANFLRDEAFSSELDRYWQELKQKAAQKEDKLLYMDWVGADTYEETVHRAYLTSFLVTYGYATLEINRLEEEIFVCPLDQPGAKLASHAQSVPVTVTFEDWQKWKRGEKQ